MDGLRRQARAQESAPERSAALDGLRGLAALMVVASHGSAGGQHLLPGLSLEGIGKHGVFLFFVLSAFLLTRQALRWPTGRRWWPQLGAYALRRVARIFPLYLLVLVAAWLLGGPGLGVPIDADALLRHLTLQQGLGIYWSIPVEFLYYLWIPPLAAWLAAPLPIALRGAGALMLLAGCMVWFPAAASPANSDQLRWYLPVLLCGSFAAWLASAPPPGQSPRLPLADLLLLAVLLISTPALLSLPADAWHREFLGWGIAWGAAVLAAHQGRFLWLQAVLESRWLGRLGQWCFGLYLLHLPVQALARRLPLPGELQAWLALAGAVLLAALAHRLVERPAMRFAAVAADRLSQSA
ncbi:acyltransferase family protein [Inhella sp.]|uniref:acyltransferase family protein n=1 Tax=Inhella sp. TaxID=1921806 RepID=UPI0035AE8BA5